MDTYALYTFDYCSVDEIQGNIFSSPDVKVDMSTEDKNLWLDHLFGDRNTDVKIQRMKKKWRGSRQVSLQGAGPR